MCVCMYVCLYVCMHACMYICMYVCTYACMYACMHECMYILDDDTSARWSYKSKDIVFLNVFHVWGGHNSSSLLWAVSMTAPCLAGIQAVVSDCLLGGDVARFQKPSKHRDSMFASAKGMQLQLRITITMYVCMFVCMYVYVWLDVWLSVSDQRLFVMFWAHGYTLFDYAIECHERITLDDVTLWASCWWHGLERGLAREHAPLEYVDWDFIHFHSFVFTSQTAICLSDQWESTWFLLKHFIFLQI